MTSRHFILYSRTYCHLCDDMLAALRALCGDAVPVQVVDVDLQPELLARYDELVPVLMGCVEGMEPVQICNYFLDENKVRHFLSLMRD